MYCSDLRRSLAFWERFPQPGGAVRRLQHRSAGGRGSGRLLGDRLRLWADGLRQDLQVRPPPEASAEA